MGHRAEVTEQLSPELAHTVLELTERLFDTMIEQQRQKVLRLAREAVPHISPEDVMNPHDFPELKAHPTFEYEDGILAGLVSAKIALRAEIRQNTQSPPPPPPAT